MFNGVVGKQYGRADVQRMLAVPLDKQGGNWDTGYTEWDGQLFIFCNINVAGRTGHDYSNRWEGSELIWQAKNGTTVHQPQMKRLLGGSMPTHIFYRQQDRMPFTYAGVARPRKYDATSPVTVHWSFKSRVAADPKDDLREVLTDRGFELSAPTKKTQKATLRDLVVYIKIENDAFPLVVGPEWVDWLTDFELAGAQRPRDRLYYHNSTMRAFPQKVHTGTDPIPFGLDFRFSSKQALQRFLDVLLGTPKPFNSEPDAGHQDVADVDPRTETETTRAARLKQSKFRSDLLKRHKGRCLLTEIDMPDLLRASHIKPWAKSSHKERVDPDNGLLLAVHLDGLFDKGLISFDESGKILISEKVTPVTRLALSLDAGWQLKISGGQQAEYLRYHRAHRFADASNVVDV
jgi:putative restriction endonuclease